MLFIVLEEENWEEMWLESIDRRWVDDNIIWKLMDIIIISIFYIYIIPISMSNHILVHNFNLYNFKNLNLALIYKMKILYKLS